MANQLAKYVVQLEAQTARYQRKLATAEKKLGRFERKNNKALSAIKSQFLALGSTALLSGFVRSIAQAGLSMDRIHRALKFVAGSTAEAAKEFEFLRGVSVRLGLDLESSATAYTKLAAAAKGTVLEGQAVRDIFTSVSKASVVMGLTVDQTKGTLRALEQMISKGTVQAEELRGQLGERLPGAFQIAARAMGKTTQELGKMLEQGQVLASDLLPKLAAELDTLFDSEIDAAADSAQAAFARLATAAFELKAAIADSGLLGALASWAEGVSLILGGLPREVEIAKRMDILRKNLEFLGHDPKMAKIILDEFTRLAKELEVLANGSAVAGTAFESLNEILVTSKLKTDLYGKGLAAFSKQFLTAEMRVASLRAKLELFGDALKPEQIQLVMDKITDIWNSGLDEIEVTSEKKVLALKEVHEKMSEFSIQAARNMQTAFADFLFDPFDKGLDGMLKSFIDTIRRMIAEAAAARFFDSINSSGGGVGGFLAGFFGGPKADGGPVSGGTSYLVGERGPELFTPAASGNITPNKGLGGITVNQNYSIAAGADWETLQKILPPMFDQNRQATIGEIRLLQTEGAL